MARALLDLEAECSDDAEDVGSDEDDAGSLMDFIDDGDVSMRSRTPSAEEASPRHDIPDSLAEESAVAEHVCFESVHKSGPSGAGYVRTHC